MKHLLLSLLVSSLVQVPSHGQDASETQPVKINVFHRESGDLLPCRIHLSDERQEPILSTNWPSWHDHFVFPGEFQTRLSAGTYHYTIERGPEFQTLTGTFRVEVNRPLQLDLQMGRIANLRERGWRSADLHVHREAKDIELLMQAEDLDVAPVITWWNARNPWANQPLPASPLVEIQTNPKRQYHLLAGEDERQGGALLYFNLDRPLEITHAEREYPSPMVFLQEAKKAESVWGDIEKPFWWDVPIWLASGLADSIGLANNHMERSSMYESEAWGKPRDTERLPPPRGNGYWTQEIYYHILNTGLRIPPSAGSASGVLRNPVGYNRVYVHTGNDSSYAAWWQALKQGRCFVTNGPLLMVRANQSLPGAVFDEFRNGELTLDFQSRIVSKDPLQWIEVIQNGKIVQRLPGSTSLDPLNLSTLTFRESGWFLVRAITANDKTFRFASTGPFYVQHPEAPVRISRQSVQFFLDWTRERMGQIQLDDPDKQREVLKYHQQAETFWLGRLAMANAD